MSYVFFAWIYVIFLLDFADVVFELLDSVILFDSLFQNLEPTCFHGLSLEL